MKVNIRVRFNGELRPWDSFTAEEKEMIGIELNRRALASIGYYPVDEDELKSSKIISMEEREGSECMTRNPYDNKCCVSQDDDSEYVSNDTFTRVNQTTTQSQEENCQTTIIGIAKNIIQGYTSKFDISEITFFIDDLSIYSGSLEKFMQITYDKDGKYLFEEKKKLLNAKVLKCIKHNDSKLFLFCEYQ